MQRHVRGVPIGSGIMAIGIYMIKNIINSKYYIGSSVNLDRRINTHFRELKKCNHENSYLQNSYNKHGKDAFKVEILETITDKSIVLIREQFYIDSLDACNRDKGYNIYTIAGSPQGRKVTKKQSEQQRKFMLENNPFKGKHHSKETKLKMSNDRKGLLSGNKNPNYGKVFTDIHRHNLSVSHQGVNDGENSHLSKLKSDDVIEIKDLILNSQMSLVEIAKNFNVTPSTISYIRSGKTWKNVGENMTIRVGGIN